jgi:gluconolactonase
MERRTFLAASAAAAVAAALPVEPAQAEALPLGDLPNWRYPDDRVEALDKRFRYPRQQ